jgi:dGTPase
MIFDIIVNSLNKPEVSMSEEGWFYVTKLREWMFEHVYLDPVTKAEEKKAANIVKSLYLYYSEELKPYHDEALIPQIVADYISGMTDQYAIRRYQDLFIPKPLTDNSNDEALFRQNR